MLHKNIKSKTDQAQIISVEELVPREHILRKINKYIDFDFIYNLVEDKYCLDNGRPSIDPVVLMKIVFIQYLFNIRSIRQTIKEIEVNIAYRWFLGYDFYDKIPHFTTFSQNYRRRFKDTDIFENIFQNILNQALEQGFVDEKIQFVDSTHVKAHANRHKNKKVTIEKKARRYQAQLDKEIAQEREENGKKPLKEKEDKERQTIVQSTTDPESGLFHKGEHKEVFAYCVETSCDKNGWILAYKSFPGNLHDSTTFLPFYEEKLKKMNPQKIVMDAGYKIPAIAKTLIDDKILPVFPYTRQKRNLQIENPYYKRDYIYDEYYNCYICPQGKLLKYKTTDREGYRQYKSDTNECKNCPNIDRCTHSKNKQKVITRHIWQDYLDITEEYRYTNQGKKEYARRKETIERQFGSAKEYHSFRYTNMKGKAKMDMKAALTFACLNMKKLALMMYRMDPNKEVFTRLFAKIHRKFDFLLNLIKTSKPRKKFLGLSSLWSLSFW